MVLNMAKVERSPRVALRAVRLAREANIRRAMQKRSESGPFLSLVIRQQPACVVEVGLGAGGMFWAFCQAAAHDATIISVDLPAARHGLPEDLLEPIENVQRFGRPTQTLHFVRRDSHDPETVEEVRRLLPCPIDLLFIDGDHTYDAVTGDYSLYSPLVRLGGLIGFHDILPHDNVPDCEVDRFWRCLPGAKLEIVSPSESGHHGGRWGGIGVIRKTD